MDDPSVTSLGLSLVDSLNGLDTVATSSISSTPSTVAPLMIGSKELDTNQVAYIIVEINIGEASLKDRVSLCQWAMSLPAQFLDGKVYLAFEDTSGNLLTAT
jgi:hypothetical protein